MWKLHRTIGAAIVRTNALLLMDRVAHTGGDAAAAFSRQSGAEEPRFFRGGPGRGVLCSWGAAAERGSVRCSLVGGTVKPGGRGSLVYRLVPPFGVHLGV